MSAPADPASLVHWLYLDTNPSLRPVEQESLRGKPIAVVPLLADTTCCIAVSYEGKVFSSAAERDNPKRSSDFSFKSESTGLEEERGGVDGVKSRGEKGSNRPFKS